MEGKTYGYIRVSSKDQYIDRQLIAFAESDFNLPKKQIYIDKISGKDFSRPEYKKLMRKLKEGDTLVIKAIDRLERNYEEILKQWRIITKEKKVYIVVLDMPLLDTRQKKENLTGTLIADLVLQILSYVAQVERENSRQCQREGIDAAMKRGVKFGRPKREKAEEFDLYYRKYMAKEISIRGASKELKVGHDTFMKWVHEKMESEGNIGHERKLADYADPGVDIFG